MDKSKATDADRLIDQLRTDLYAIHFRWLAVKELWQTSADEMRMVHSYGQDFFAVVQQAQVDDLTIGLARFTDVDKGGENQTVNLAAAIALVLGNAELQSAKQRLAGIWPKIKDFRDRVLAHRDYRVFVSGSDKPLLGITYGEIRRFIEEVTAIMQALDMAYDGKRIEYDKPTRLGSWPAIFFGLLRAERLDQISHRVASGLSVTIAETVLTPPKP